MYSAKNNKKIMNWLEKYRTQRLGKDPETQKRFGLKPLTDEQINKIHDITLEIYKDILAICEQHHLVIMMSGGSALGTVRHKGFIPWDDDMDLMMPRADYEKFINLFDSTLSHKYNIDIKSEFPGYFLRVDKKHTKMIGLFHNPKYPPKGIGIDVFPIDSVPNNKLLYYLKGIVIAGLVFILASRRIYMNKKALSTKYYGHTLPMLLFYYLRIIIGFLSCVISYKRWHNWYNKFVRSSKKTKYVTIASGRKHYYGETLPIEVFLPVKQMMFEGVTAYVPNDYDRYLTNLYGNYMEIPPENKREHHAVVEMCY